jgi:hypothetical protein
MISRTGREGQKKNPPEFFASEPDKALEIMKKMALKAPAYSSPITWVEQEIHGS